MLAQYIAFGIFSVFTLGGAIGVVWSRNLIHSGFYLILSLFGVAGLFILLSAPFMAAVQVLVYIGAIAILFIFAVMLTRGMTRLEEINNRQWWFGFGITGLLFATLMVAVIWPAFGPNGSIGSEPVAMNVATTVDLGIALVDGNQFVLPFEVSSLLLTAAMIGAIVIAREDD